MHVVAVFMVKVKNCVCSSCTQQIKECDPEKVNIGNSSYAVVSLFCYLGDMLSAGDGSESSSITLTMCTWKKLRKLLTLLTSYFILKEERGIV